MLRKPGCPNATACPPEPDYSSYSFQRHLPTKQTPPVPERRPNQPSPHPGQVGTGALVWRAPLRLLARKFVGVPFHWQPGQGLRARRPQAAADSLQHQARRHFCGCLLTVLPLHALTPRPARAAPIVGACRWSCGAAHTISGPVSTCCSDRIARSLVRKPPAAPKGLGSLPQSSQPSSTDPGTSSCLLAGSVGAVDGATTRWPSRTTRDRRLPTATARSSAAAGSAAGSTARTCLHDSRLQCSSYECRQHSHPQRRHSRQCGPHRHRCHGHLPASGSRHCWSAAHQLCRQPKQRRQPSQPPGSCRRLPTTTPAAVAGTAAAAAAGTAEPAGSAAESSSSSSSR